MYHKCALDKSLFKLLVGGGWLFRWYSWGFALSWFYLLLLWSPPQTSSWNKEIS